MKWLSTFALVAVICISLGCSAPDTASRETRGTDSTLAPTGSLSSRDIEEIGLQRTGCFGPCPVYKVTIKRDGSVTFDGKEHVLHKRSATSKIAPSDWNLLVAALERTNFFALQDRYATKEDGCPSIWTDNPSLEITVVRDSGVKRVLHYQGCRGLDELDAIDWLGTTIDLVASTRQWIGHDSEHL